MAASGESPASSPPASTQPLRCVLWHAAGTALPTDLLNSLTRRIGRIAVCTDSYTALAEVCTAGRSSRGADGMGRPSGTGTVLILIQPEQLVEVAETLAEIRMHAPRTQCWKFDAGANPKLSAVVESDVSAWTPRGNGGASAVAGAGRLPNPARTTNRDDQQTLSSDSSPLPPAAVAVRRPPTTPSSPHSTPRPPAHAPPVAPAAPPPALRLAGTADAMPPSERDRWTERHPAGHGSDAGPHLTFRSGGSQAGSPPARPILTAEEMSMLLGDDPHDAADGHEANGRGSRARSDGSRPGPSAHDGGDPA